MPDKTNKPRLFYGWIIVLAGVLINGATIGVFNNTLSAFVKPVTEDLGFARGQFTLYNTLMGLSAVVMMPVFGEWFRKGRMKQLMPVCACLVALAALGFSISSHLWQFYLFAILAGGAINGCSTIAVSTLVSNWFIDKKGLATGIALSGSGLFAAVMIPVVTQVIEAFGWRWGFRLLSAVGLGVLLPTMLLLVKVKPSDMGLAPLGSKAEDRQLAGESPVGFTRAEAFKMPSFYLVIAGLVAAVTAGTTMQAHALSYYTDIGFSSAFASSVISLTMAALIVGKIAMGWVFDHFGVMVGCVSASVSFLVALTALIFSAVPLTPFVFAIFLGYGLSLGSVAASLITVQYFGTRDFSRIYAVAGVAGAMGSAIGQPLGGFIYDFTGSYVPAWTLDMALVAGTIALFIAAEFFSKRAWKNLTGKA